MDGCISAYFIGLFTNAFVALLCYLLPYICHIYKSQKLGNDMRKKSFVYFLGNGLEINSLPISKDNVW